MSKSKRMFLMAVAFIGFGVIASLFAYLFLDYRQAEPFYMISLVLGAMAAACLVLR